MLNFRTLKESALLLSLTFFFACNSSTGTGPTTTTPGAPTGVSATAGNGLATVSWTAPTSDGGFAITGYFVTSSPGGNTCSTTEALNCVVTALTNGTSYTFTVTATNATGTGTASSPSATATPVAAVGIFSQQGSKLVGTSAVGASWQGGSVSISSDGNTAIVGGLGDDNSAGAAWVWTRSGGVWTQQGSKLVGTGAVGSAGQGNSVAISSDGNTAIIAGEGDNGDIGAVWVWTRSGGVWTQQGSKLVGTGVVGIAEQGNSVALSSDGNTAIIGGPGDNSNAGAAWVWTRSGGVWTQQGSKLVGTGAVNGIFRGSRQGWSVALSSDGNTAIVGGDGDNDLTGAAWVWTRSGEVWTQQGSKLVGTGAFNGTVGIGVAQGYSVALSSDGNTAIIGGPYDYNLHSGAAWVWTRSGGVWTQQGSKLVDTGAVITAGEGESVALSSDGNTAIVCCYGDSSGGSAAWVWIRSGGIWAHQGGKLFSPDGSGFGSSISLSSDGNTAIVGGYIDNGYVGAAWVFTRN